jgi:hypothetical protein
MERSFTKDYPILPPLFGNAKKKIKYLGGAVPKLKF